MWSKIKQAADEAASESEAHQAFETESQNSQVEKDEYVIEVSAPYLSELGEELSSRLLRSPEELTKARHTWRGSIMGIWETNRVDILLRYWTVWDAGGNSWSVSGWDRTFYLSELGQFDEEIRYIRLSELRSEYELRCFPMYPDVVHMVDGKIQETVAVLGSTYAEVTRKVAGKTEHTVKKFPKNTSISKSEAVVDETTGIVYVPKIGSGVKYGETTEYEELSVKLGRYFHESLSSM